MYIETVSNRNSPPCILLRESYRVAGKVKKRTLANVTDWPVAVREGLARLLKNSSGKDGEALDGGFEIVRSLSHGHVAAVLGVMQQLDIGGLLGKKRCRERDLAMALIAARILSPGSKLGSARELSAATATTSLGERLGLGTVDENDLYNAMDWLLTRQEMIERELAGRHLRDGTLVLYDLSSSYVHGRCCSLAKLGHSRDGKPGTLQIEYGLLCDADGRPVAVDVFAGNTGDPTTVATQIVKLRDKFKLQRVVLVGDRGMLTEARIRDDLMLVEGLEWITALRSEAIAKLIDEGRFAPSLFDERDMAEIQSPDFPGERLVVCRNPLLAQERRRKREELLQATEKELARIATAVNRRRNPLRGQDNIGVKVGKVVNKYKVAKHFELKIGDDTFTFCRRDQKIADEARLDGFYVIRTNVDQGRMSSTQVVGSYKSLSRVERAFRCLKTVDLKIRPIYHYDANRVRAHVLICMLAYYVEWHLREALAPLLFQDDDRQAAAATRKSPVAQAAVSPRAQAKAITKQTADGLPVHSFQTLLQDLSTLTMNVIRPVLPSSPDFVKLAIPTPTQARALQLLGVSV